MKRLERCPDSLVSIIANVLDSKPRHDLAAATNRASPTQSCHRAGLYTETVTLTGRQLADFGGLIIAAANKRPFVWTDPQDRIDKLVTLAGMPEVFTTCLPEIGPNSRFELRLSLRYDKSRAAEQAKSFESTEPFESM